MISIEELHQLKKLGNVPFEAFVLRNMLSHYQSPEKKILKLVRDGYIIRIKQGLYVGCYFSMVSSMILVLPRLRRISCMQASEAAW